MAYKNYFNYRPEQHPRPLQINSKSFRESEFNLQIPWITINWEKKKIFTLFFFAWDARLLLQMRNWEICSSSTDPNKPAWLSADKHRRGRQTFLTLWKKSSGTHAKNLGFITTVLKQKYATPFCTILGSKHISPWHLSAISHVRCLSCANT